MRRFLYIITLSLSFIAFGQNEYEWVSRYNGAADDFDGAGAITIDSKGRIYGTGYSKETFGHNSFDIVTIRFDKNDGTIIWSETFSGDGLNSDYGLYIVADDSGFVYVVGSVYYDSTGRDIITLKYDSLGNLIWAKNYNSYAKSSEGAQYAAIDNQGNVYVAGMTADSLIVIKYNSAGDEAWVRYFRGSIYAAWWKTIRVHIVGHDLFMAGISGRDILYARLHKDTGVSYWEKIHDMTNPSEGRDRLLDMIVDEDKNMVFVGDYYDSSGGFNSPTAIDAFTVMYDSLGNLKWFKQVPNIHISSDGTYYVKLGIYLRAVTIAKDGSIYVVGQITEKVGGKNVLTIKYDKLGNEIWRRTLDGGGEAEDLAIDVITDRDNNVYVGGVTINEDGNGAVGWGPTVIKYTPNGDKLWSYRFRHDKYGGGAAQHCLITDNENNAYLFARVDFSGKNDIALIKFGLKSAIEDELKNSGILIFPNPVSEVLNIQITEKFIGKIEILNQLGSTVYESEINNSTQVTVPVYFLPGGMYYLRCINQNNNYIITKFIKL
jgi:hypothetical protein